MVLLEVFFTSSREVLFSSSSNTSPEHNEGVLFKAKAVNAERDRATDGGLLQVLRHIAFSSQKRITKAHLVLLYDARAGGGAC